MENYFELKLKSISENEKFARNTVAGFLVPLDPTLSELDDIKTAVSEAVTNCIVHGYEKAMMPFFTTKPDSDRSGMGFTLMQSFMDDFEVYSEKNKGTTIVMTKLIGNEGVHD